MGDIVDELRDYIPGMPVGWLLDEAKDEIEALRAEVERLKLSTVDLAAMKKALEEVDRLRAESERQRALFNDMCGTAKRALKDLGKAADEIERLRAALDVVRASGLLIGSTTLHDKVRAVVHAALAEGRPNE